jgi:hypothetical protein
MNNPPVGGRSSETYSHPYDMYNTLLLRVNDKVLHPNKTKDKFTTDFISIDRLREWRWEDSKPNCSERYLMCRR